jgi:hypothetical protein
VSPHSGPLDPRHEHIHGQGAALGARCKERYREHHLFHPVSSQEVGPVIHALDQIELMAQLGRDLVRQAIGIAFRGTQPGQLFEPILRIKAIRKLFGRTDVSQLVEREFAAFGNLPGAPHGGFVFGKQAQHLGRRLEEAIGMPLFLKAGMVDRGAPRSAR